MFSSFTSCCGYREEDEEGKMEKRYRKQYKKTIKRPQNCGRENNEDFVKSKEDIEANEPNEDIENQIQAIPSIIQKDKFDEIEPRFSQGETGQTDMGFTKPGVQGKEPMVLFDDEGIKEEKAAANESMGLINEYGDNFTDFQWDGPDDEDEEIPEMAALANAYEKELGVKFSKRGISEFVENFMRTENAESNPDWKEKLTSPQFKFYLKDNGSQFSKDQPFLRSEQFFNKKCQVDKLISVMFKPQHVLKWDKNLRACEEIEVTPGKKSYGILYTENKKQFSLCGRDFYEKTFNFYHNGKFYRYSTSVENSEKPGPNGEEPLKQSPSDQVVRAFTIYSFSMIERLPDGQIKHSQSCQMDWYIKAPTFLVNTFFPKAAKEWYANVVKFYNKNHKNI